jgi:hypothetical protein
MGKELQCVYNILNEVKFKITSFTYFTYYKDARIGVNSRTMKNNWFLFEESLKGYLRHILDMFRSSSFHLFLVFVIQTFSFSFYFSFFRFFRFFWLIFEVASCCPNQRGQETPTLAALTGSVANKQQFVFYF